MVFMDKQERRFIALILVVVALIIASFSVLYISGLVRGRTALREMADLLAVDAETAEVRQKLLCSELSTGTSRASVIARMERIGLKPTSNSSPNFVYFEIDGPLAAELEFNQIDVSFDDTGHTSDVYTVQGMMSDAAREHVSCSRKQAAQLRARMHV